VTRPTHVFGNGRMVFGMQQVAEHPDGKTIDLFHVTSAPNARINNQLRPWGRRSNSESSCIGIFVDAGLSPNAFHQELFHLR
jgi:hypothetical protein